MVRPQKRRSQVACKACHSQKLKCNGGTPCERCQLRGRECVYPVKERFTTVSESYLRRLEMHAQHGAVMRSPTSSTLTAEVACPQSRSPEFATSLSPPNNSRVVKEEVLEDCSAEFFVQRLRQLPWAATSSDVSPKGSASCGTDSYTYSRLKFDFLQTEVSFRLPPRPYAFLLLQAFEEGFSEYHWFIRKSFRARLLLTYSDPASQSHDRNWLCRVSVVLALAESFNRSRMTSSTHMELGGQQPPSPFHAQPPASSLSPMSQNSQSSQQPPLPPGSDFFEQGLMLLKMSPEEPVPEDVEALNLIAFYCYSLNRRKTAYSYASQSVALAKLLQLHKPRAESRSGAGAADDSVRVINEHRKRLWWTSYCMDRMISTELGVAPALSSVPEGMELPSSVGLTPDEMDEFSDPSLLTASTQLCEIKRNVVRTAAQHVDADDEGRLDVIRPCLDMLQEWRASLPAAMAFTFEDSLPTTLMEAQYGRILASIYLRYHQCFILLLRPLYLQKLSSIVQQRRLNSQQVSLGRFSISPMDGGDPVRAVKIKCLQAARNNCKILLGLWNYDKIAKFGYWESLHLFSGLAILALAQVSIERGEDLPPFAEDDDTALYTRTRALLREMALVGNPAAIDHDSLLSDVEAMVKKVSEEERSARHTSAEADHLAEPLSFSEFMFADMGGNHQIWCDTDWESILSTMTQGI